VSQTFVFVLIHDLYLPVNQICNQIGKFYLTLFSLCRSTPCDAMLCYQVKSSQVAFNAM